MQRRPVGHFCLFVIKTSQRGVSFSGGQWVNMWDWGVGLVEVLVSQRSSEQEHWGSETHDDGEHEVWLCVSMVAEPLAMLVLIHLWKLIGFGAAVVLWVVLKYDATPISH